MSILIKGIEMPKEPWECPCHNGENGRCNVTQKVCFEIPKDCPLSEVSSAQSEQFVKGCRNCKYGKYNDFWKTHFCYNPNDCTEWNLWEPDAQPERLKGHWIFVHPLQEDDGGAYMCSECRTGNWEIDPKRYFFCPYCGADMIGDTE